MIFRFKDCKKFGFFRNKRALVVERSVRLERFDYITVLQNSFSLITFK